MLVHLRKRADEMSNSCCYGLPAEVKADGMEKCEVAKAL